MCEMGPDQQPHIFHEIAEILNYTTTNRPDNNNVKIVGVYESNQGDHLLTSYNELKEQVTLDMCLVEKYPVVGSVLELYGTLEIDPIPTIVVHFWTDLGTDTELIDDYLKCLRTLRHVN